MSSGRLVAASHARRLGPRVPARTPAPRRRAAASAAGAHATSRARRARRARSAPSAAEPQDPEPRASSAKNGSAKIRCRDSGEADVPEPRGEERERSGRRRRTRRAAQPGRAREAHEPERGQRRAPAAIAAPPGRGEVAARRARGTRATSSRPAELLAAAADAHVEPAGEHEVGEPERHARGRRRPRTARAPRAAGARASEHVRRPGSRATSAPYGCVATASRIAAAQSAQRAPPAALERRQEREVRERAREEEEAVHPPVDAVEEEHPARRRDDRRDERRRAARRAARPRSATSGTLATAKSDRDEPQRRRARRRCARRATRTGSGAARRRAPRGRSRRACRAAAGPTKSASVSSSCGGQAMSWCEQEAPPRAPSRAATESGNQFRDERAGEIEASGLGRARNPCSLRAFAHDLAGIVASLDRHADLRVPVSRRAHLRGLPAHG